MPDINHPARHALAALGVGDDPATRSLYYRWAGYMADVRWGRYAGYDAARNRMRKELLAHFNDDRDEMSRHMEILRGHVFAAIDHAKVLGAQKRAEEQGALKPVTDTPTPGEWYLLDGDPNGPGEVCYARSLPPGPPVFRGLVRFGGPGDSFGVGVSYPMLPLEPGQENAEPSPYFMSDEKTGENIVQTAEGQEVRYTVLGSKPPFVERANMTAEQFRARLASQAEEEPGAPDYNSSRYQK